MMHHITELPRPLLVGSLRNRNVTETIADIKNCVADGARAFILHIQMLDAEYRRPDELKKIFAATSCPVMAIYYRWGNDLKDGQRVQEMLTAIECGAKCMDLPADTFDADSQASLKGCALPFAAVNPAEISMRPECIQKQKQVVTQAHALGAQVLISAHVLNTHLSCAQAVSLAQEIESRGADIVKIVTACPDVDHALHMLQTTVELKKKLKVPFLYICTGPHGALVRPLGPLFGSMLIFGHHEYNERSNTAKQLLGNMQELYRILPWRVEDYLKEEES